MSMENAESALAVLRHAIHNEITGQQFYSDAAFYCIDPWAKEVFAELARDEEEHTRLLLVEYESLSTSGRWINPAQALASSADVDITRFTFAETTLPGGEGTELFPRQHTAEQAVDRRADDLAALAVGIQMEQAALSLYGGEAQRATDPAAQEAYRFLIEEETRHLHQLQTEWEKLAGRPFQDQIT
jgi:rubrerythrin